MSDVVGSAVIEVVADARRLKAGLAEAKKSIASLGQGQADASGKASRSIDNYIAKLQVQSATIGKSARETELFKLATRGASDAQIAAANSALLVAEGHEKMIANAAKARTAIATIATTAVVAGATIAAMADKQIDLLDKLANVSRATGISAEDLAGLSLAAKQSGTDFDSVAKAVARMTVEMGKSPEEFRAIGITAKEPLEALKQFADIFAVLPDLQQRNALAQRVFSKSWQEMAPLLSEGGQAIGDAVEKGKKLSRVTQENAERAKEYNDRLEELKFSSVSLANSVLPGLTKIVTAAADERLKTGSIFQSIAAAARVAGEQILPKYAAQLEGARERLAHFQEQAKKDPGNAEIQARVESTKREVEALEEKRKKLDEIERAQQRPAGGRASQRADIQAELDSIAADQAAKAQRAIGQLNAEAHIALLRKIEGEREAMREKSISREAEATRARLLSIAEISNVETALAQLELDTIAKRVQADTAAHSMAVRISKDAKDALESQRAAGIKLYDSLIGRASDYQKVATDAHRSISELVKKAADDEDRSRKLIAGARTAALPPDQQRVQAFQDSLDQERRGRTALLTSDFEGLKKVRAEAEQTAQAFIRLGEIDSAEKLLETFDSFGKTAAGVQKFALGSIASAAEEAKAKVDQQIAEISTKIKEMQEKVLDKGIPIFASLDSIQQTKDTIRDALEKEKFEIKITGKISEIVRSGNTFSDVPQFARGGRASGLALVGEEGPELVQFRSTARVYSAPDTRRMLGEFTRAGHSVQALASGGTVTPAPAGASSSMPTDVVRIELAIGGKTHNLFGERDRVQQLQRDLRFLAMDPATP